MSLVRLSGHLTPALGVRPVGRLDPGRTLRLAFICDDPMHGPTPGLLHALSEHLRRHGLDAQAGDVPFGVVDATGPVAAVERALLVTLMETDDGGYQPTDEPTLPRALALGVAGIVGLSAHPGHLRHPRPPRPRTPMEATGFGGYRPPEIEAAYGIDLLPAADPAQRAVLLEFSSGYRAQDLDLFTGALGLPPVRPVLHAVDGGANDGGRSPADVEATLDIEWLWAIAPGCDLHVIEAPAGATDGSFGLHLVHALRAAQALRPAVVSISYGDAESLFPPAVLTAINTLVGRLQQAGADVFIASGDQGAYGMHDPSGRPIRHADAPASCPEAIAVGGTHLQVAADGTIMETGWTDLGGNGAGGGGYSSLFPATAAELPFLPQGATARGIPDIALDADPLTGYLVVFEGQPQVVGGTSVAAPVAAAATLRLRAQVGQVLLTPRLYTLPDSCFRDIVEGNNSYGGVPGYQCGPGWDAVTGRGAPLFDRIAAALAGQG